MSCRKGKNEMLTELHAKNFALFKEINVEFSNGLNVVTGESGAGKSLFLLALRALCGEKPPFVDEESVVEGRFVSENGEEVLSVKYTPSRSSAKLNGSLVSLSQLKKIAESKLAIHSQEAPSILRDPKNHTFFVDLFEPKIHILLKEYKDYYSEYKNVKKALNDAPNLEILVEERDALEREIERMENALLSEEEYLQMTSRYQRLTNAKDIIQNSRELLFLIREENGIQDLLIEALRRAKEIRRLDEKFESILAGFQNVASEMAELERDVEDYGMSEEFNENELFELEKRIAEIETIKRRYGPTLGDVESTYKAKLSELSELDTKIEEVKSAEKKLNVLKEKLLPLAKQISEFRKSSAEALLKKTEENLRDLGMKDAIMDFVQREVDLGENGSDFVEFFGSTNRGSPLLPLSKIASGGETARLYLALEAALGEKLPVEIVVFDEVASAVGIRTADVVAKKLKEISKKTQLVVITHMPQIASLADRHFKVEKFVENGKTFSQIRELSDEERREEITEMFGKIPQEVKNE